MPPRLSLSRRLRTAAGWPTGVTLTSFRYLWRTTPMTRREDTADWDDLLPLPLPDGVSHDEILTPDAGAGPLFHRRYAVTIAGARMTPEQVIRRVARDVDCVAPTEFASFQKVEGDDRGLAVGDEYVVRMAGPWDGPVRVIATSPTSFRLATLASHLEAGQIEFRALRDGEHLRFEIESWARSSSRTVHALYDVLRMAKESQTHMWVSMLERVVDLTGGRRHGRLEVLTRRAAAP